MTKKTSDPLLIETATTLKIMNRNLFGGDGQVGALHYIMEQHKELSAKIDTNRQELLDRIDAKKDETDKKIEVVKSKVTWYSGGIAALGTGVTLFLTWLGVHAALAANAKGH